MNPLVSICVITYNQEKYIQETLDGISIQKVSFPVEILIADDCSADGTRDICQRYYDRNKETVRLLFNEVNLGANRNFVKVLTEAKGKYIALCEGDDYWTDPLKLQKQIDFLEQHPDFSICFHDVTDKNERNGEIVSHEKFYKILLTKDIFEFQDILRENFMATLSVVFRNNIRSFPDWFSSLPFGDWSLHSINAQYGKIKYFPENMGVYRIHSGGVWSSASLSDRLKALTNFYFLINKHFEYKYDEIIHLAIVEQIIKLAAYNDELLNAKTWLESQIKADEEAKTWLESQIKADEEAKTWLESQILNRDKVIRLNEENRRQLEDSIDAKDNQIFELSEIKMQFLAEIDDLQNKLSAKTRENGEILIARENFRINWERVQIQLDALKNSREYKFAKEISKIFNKLFPRKSFIRRFPRFSYKVIRFFYRKGRNLFRKIKRKKQYMLGFLAKYKNRPKAINFKNKKWSSGKPVVSIILLVFNYKRFFKDAFDSVLNQTFDNFELIIIDGGSTDGTREYIGNYFKDNRDKRIRIIFQKNRTCVGEDRLTGLKTAKGKYALFFDADDLIDPTYLEKAVYIFETKGVDHVSCWIREFKDIKENIFAENSTVYQTKGIPIRACIDNNLTTNTSFVRLSYWKKNKIGYLTKKSHFEDWDFWIRYALKGGSYYVIKEALHYYRKHGSSWFDKSRDDCEKYVNNVRDRFKHHKNMNKGRFLTKIEKKQNSVINVINRDLNLKKYHTDKNQKTILLCIPYLTIGGAEKILFDIFKNFKSNGYRIVVVVTLKAEDNMGDFTPVFREITDEIYHLPNFLEKSEYFGFIEYLINSRNIKMMFQCGSAFLYDALPGIKKLHPDLTVFDQLFNEIGHFDNNIKHQKFIDHNFLANNVIMKKLIEKGDENIDLGKFEVIIHGVDNKKEFVPDIICQNKDEQLEEIAKDNLVISFMGRHSIEKGPLNFVEIVHSLEDDNRLSFVMTGNGPEHGNVKSKINEYSLSGRIYLTGFVSDPRYVLSKTDVLLITSSLDGLPIVLMEALSMGKVVISTKVGGIPELITDGVNGYLCDVGDNRKFCEIIQMLASDKKILNKIGKKAREFSEKNLGIDEMNRKYLQAINKFN